MTTTAHTPTVAEATEAKTRQVMAMRARLIPGYGTRQTRAKMLAEVDDLLEEYNLLTLGR